MFGLAVLFVGVFRFVSTRHGMTSVFEGLNRETAPEVPAQIGAILRKAARRPIFAYNECNFTLGDGFMAIGNGSGGGAAASAVVVAGTGVGTSGSAVAVDGKAILTALALVTAAIASAAHSPLRRCECGST